MQILFEVKLLNEVEHRFLQRGVFWNWESISKLVRIGVPQQVSAGVIERKNGEYPRTTVIRDDSHNDEQEEEVEDECLAGVIDRLPGFGKRRRRGRKLRREILR